MATDRQYQNALRDLLGGKNDVERGIILDADCAVNRGIGGAFVQCWFWIADDDMDDEGPYGVGA